MTNISDYARSVSILVEIAGNPEAKLDEINKKVDDLAGKQINVGGRETNSNMERLAGNTDKVSNAASSMSSKLTNSFSNVRSSMESLQGAITNMASSLMGMTVGGAVSGLAWLDKAKSDLYISQIEKSINANKKLGVSFDMLKVKASEIELSGEDTSSDAIKELYGIMNMGQKYIGKGSAAVTNADAISDFYFSRREAMEAYGIDSPETLVKRAIQTTGKISDRSKFGKDLALAVGLSLDDSSMRSAKKRIESFVAEGKLVKMDVQLDTHPWVVAETNIKRLKSAIGDSIATPMAIVTKIFSGFVDTIIRIPFGIGPGLIGIAGMLLALASAASLVIGVLTPLYGVMKAINVATGASTALKWLLTGANTAQATSEEILAIQMGAENAMRETQIVTENTSFASRLRLVGITAKDTLVKYANTAANYLHLSSIVSIIGMENISFGSKIKLIAVKAWDTAATVANSAANYLGVTSLFALAAASGVASTGMGILASLEALVLSPLFAIAAGVLLVAGAFALLLSKAGILKPLLEGISKIDFGKVFGKVFSLDFKGAWGDIKKGFSDIKFPSLAEALTNVFGGNSLISIMNRVFGIPLFTIANWITKIHDLLKPLLNIISDLWSLINRGLNWIRDGLGITKQQKEAKVKTIAEEEGVYQTKSGAWGKIQKGASQERPSEDSQTFQSFTPIEGSRLAIAIENANKAPKGFFEGIPGINDLTKAINENTSALKTKVQTNIINPVQNLVAKINPSAITAEKQSEDILSSNGITFNIGTGFYEKNGQIIPDDDVSKLLAESRKNSINVPAAGIGGFVTNSGIALVHEGEPIIPAEIASSSRLQEVLGNIATGKGNSNTAPNIQVSMSYSAPATNNGIYLDKMSFERAVKEIIGKVTRTYGAY